MDREESIKSPKTILQAVVLILPTLALIVMQPNLSTTICVAALFCALLYIAGLSYKIVGPALLILIPAVNHFSDDCSTAESAIAERLPTETYSCVAGT